MEQTGTVAARLQSVQNTQSKNPERLGKQDRGCLHELFEEQVDLRPDAPALICGDQCFSYRDLEARANQLARYLKLRGAGPGKFVGIYLERSSAPIIAILACLKSGATYIPIDPSYPKDRIRHILEETGAIILLTESSLGVTAQDVFDGLIFELDILAVLVSQLPTDRLARNETGVSPHDLCYVIYTSGTTGRPKGVMTEHGHAFKFVHAFNEVCGTSPQDRIYQGFSLSFDGSVEEIWMAYSNGSALVVGNRETPRFGNELGQFLAESRVSYFSTVPTMLSTITDPIPSLKWLVVSGEICPPELVNRWTRPGLRMLNVYGPTEATVNTTAAECIAGHPITIGHPLRGYELFILDGAGVPVPSGEKGELFVGGETLARGYLKQPELTAERFVNIPGINGGSRLYRTGDLVRYNPEGELEFFGRIDSQVKIRGYRVELAEIESILLEHEAIRSASVRLLERDGLQELAAYIVVEREAAVLDRTELLLRLESRVPPYMIPGYLDQVDELPMLTSGKVDRSRLPHPVLPLLRTGMKVVLPENELENKIAAVWSRIFGVAEVSVEDDFFLNFGGHSLLAAQMITRLRDEAQLQVTIRDAYRFPTIRKLATYLALLPEKVGKTNSISSRTVFESLSRRTRLTTSVLQAISIYLLYGIGMIPLGLFYLLGADWIQEQISPAQLFGFGAMILILTWPVLLILSIVAKWVIIGRYRPGRYPLWGAYYFRWWLAGRFQAFSGAAVLVGTPLMPLYFRLMGARVGSRCTLDTIQCSIWDLVTIGDETSIGADTQLLGCRVENGMLILGHVEIGSRCFIGIHSALGLDVKMGDDSRLDDQSLLPDDQEITPGLSYGGSPAQPKRVLVPEGLAGNQTPYSRRRTFLFGLAHLLLIEVLGLLLFVPSIPFFGLWYVAYRDGGAIETVGAAIVSVPFGFIFYCLFVAGLKRLVLNAARPGIYSVESMFYLRKWFVDELLRLSRVVLLPLYTTLYLPFWLRLMGAKIGARAELSTVWYFSPELIDVGEESFFADGSIIGGKRFFRGFFEIGINRVGRRSFVGNSAILPVGMGLGDHCLLGVQSIPPSDMICTPNGTEWLGSPAFSLPHRAKVGNFDNSVTFRPTRKLYFQRAIIDGLRILIPGYTVLSAGVAGSEALSYFYIKFGILVLWAMAPLVGIFMAMYSTLIVVLIKKLVMGTFRPVIKPLWSKYVWLNEMTNGAYEALMAPAIAPLLGTPFVALPLRLLGCKIGRHTYIATTLFSEFDLVEVGNYAALNSGAVIQNHLFEDRVMKSSHLKIGDGCSVGNMAVILYDSEMQEGASLGPLSLLMKGETLQAYSRWHGTPTMQVREMASDPELQTTSFNLPGLLQRIVRNEEWAMKDRLF
jgi:non-ribosomal peptide synthetase-like protein